jgi:hypothetical protein
MNALACQHCGHDLSSALVSYGRRLRTTNRPVHGTLAGQLGGHPIVFCNSLCRDQWDRLESLAQVLTGHEWETKPAKVFEDGDAAEGFCSCGYTTSLNDEIDVARLISWHLHMEARKIERRLTELMKGGGG